MPLFNYIVLFLSFYRTCYPEVGSAALANNCVYLQGVGGEECALSYAFPSRRFLEAVTSCFPRVSPGAEAPSGAQSHEIAGLG